MNRYETGCETLLEVLAWIAGHPDTPWSVMALEVGGSWRFVGHWTEGLN